MEIKEYLLSLKDGERVIETTLSALYGRCGTVYHNKDNSPCVQWDKKSGEDGHMGTGVTEGTRRVSEVIKRIDVVTLPEDNSCTIDFCPDCKNGKRISKPLFDCGS
jgi:hypothetical protein